MFKQLKRLFSRNTSTEAPAGTTATAVRSPGHQAAQHRPVERPRPAAPPPESVDEDISISLKAVLDNLPPELKQRVIPMELGGATMTVAVHKILAQLPQGAVRLTFGELRRAAPQLFTPGDQCDQQPFDLPLPELLARLNPALLKPAAPRARAPHTDVMEDCFNLGGATDGLAAVPDIFPSLPQPASGPMRVPLPSSVPASAPAAEPESPLTVALAPLAADWPAEVRAEISPLLNRNAQITLPAQLVQQGMQHGKVAFPWQTLRAWIQPPPAATISRHDATILELPLEVLMPLFMTRLKNSTRTQPRVVVDESIPPLFAPSTVAEKPAPVAGNTDPTSTNAPVEKPKTPSTDFKNRRLSPTEVVTRACDLGGVAGAMVVLPEGLLVAGKISTDQNPDGLAAFVARALGRTSQCAEESQLGELDHLEFGVSGVPWRIFRLHGVLFAAFGRAGGTLPIPQLATLAGEFDRKK